MAALPNIGSLTINSNIKVFSYNIAWEINKPTTGHFGQTGNYCKKKKNVTICRKNIAKEIRNRLLKNYDFLAIQEIPFKETPGYPNLDIPTWINLIGLDQSKYHIFTNMSGFEGMITIINKNKYNIIDEFSGEVAVKGRPFAGIYTQSKSTNEYILFINIHAGHGSENDSAQISNDIEKKWSKYLPQRVIMAGDINRDVTNAGNKSINIYKMQLYNTLAPRSKTCCGNKADSSMNMTNRPSDHILDSMPNSFIGKTKAFRGTFPFSDHLNIEVELKPKNIQKVKPIKKQIINIPWNKREYKLKTTQNYFPRLYPVISGNSGNQIRTDTPFYDTDVLIFPCDLEFKRNADNKIFKLVEYFDNTNKYLLAGYADKNYINNGILSHPKVNSVSLRIELFNGNLNYFQNSKMPKKKFTIPNGTKINLPCGTSYQIANDYYMLMLNKNNPDVYGYIKWSDVEEIKKGGGKDKKRKNLKIRKHKGIIQTGQKKGKLKKGFKYSGKRLKSGIAEIIKVKK